MSIRLIAPLYMPPAQIVRGTTSYSGTAGQLLDVPAADTDALTGWTAIAPSGPTSGRPFPAAAAWYVDTDLGAAIVGDGRAWRNPVTGAVV